MKLKVLPPLVLLFSLLCAHLLNHFAPIIHLTLPFKKWILIGFITTGLIILLFAVVSFWRSKTTVHPHNPLDTTTIVKTGLFRFTRNPMYLGMLCILLGYCYFLASLSPFMMPVFFVMYITAFQIKPEEVLLEEKFGDVYISYKQSVRRWL